MTTTQTIFILCECCALKLANDDESGCRDFHGHNHADFKVPAGTVITQFGQTWDGVNALTCHGHADGVIEPGQTFWVAEAIPHLTEDALDVLFDADAATTRTDAADPDRFDWLIQDGELVHAPVTGWAWTCPECGSTGEQDLDELLLNPHGSQHAAGQFDQIVPLHIEPVRQMPAA